MTDLIKISLSDKESEILGKIVYNMSIKYVIPLRDSPSVSENELCFDPTNSVISKHFSKTLTSYPELLTKILTAIKQAAYETHNPPQKIRPHCTHRNNGQTDPERNFYLDLRKNNGGRG